MNANPDGAFFSPTGKGSGSTKKDSREMPTSKLAEQVQKKAQLIAMLERQLEDLMRTESAYDVRGDNIIDMMWECS